MSTSFHTHVKEVDLVPLACEDEPQYTYNMYSMRGSRKGGGGGGESKIDNFFFIIDKEIEDTNTTINWPSSARQRNAIEMVFRWRADNG